MRFARRESRAAVLNWEVSTRYKEAAIKLIEKEIVIAADGKLPPDFCEAFGRKARVTVYLQEQEQGEMEGADFLSDLAGKIRAFRDVDDPVALQRDLRDSWKRSLEG